MKTLKKTLCLVLAVVMVVGVLVLPANAATTTAADADAEAAFKTLFGYGVMQGVDGNNTPGLSKNINRQDMAAIVYRIMTGDTEGKYKDNYVGTADKFADSATFATWAKGYIGYVRNQGIFVGDEKGNFKPEDYITGDEVLTVLLRCIGYGQNGEFTGASWAENAEAQATRIHLFGNATGYLDVKANMSKVISRGIVAKLTYNAVKAPMVTYFNGEPSIYQDNQGRPVAPNTPDAKPNPALISTGDNSDKVEVKYDEWGTPSKDVEQYVYFNYPQTKVTSTKPIPLEPMTNPFWTAKSHCDLCAELKVEKAIEKIDVYTNGYENKTTLAKLDPLNTTAQIGAQGRYTAVYDTNNDKKPDVIVYKDTLLAEVTNVANATFDAAGHLRTPATLTLKVYDGPKANVTTATAAEKDKSATDLTGAGDTGAREVTLTNGSTNYTYTKGQFLLVNYHQNDVAATKDVDTDVRDQDITDWNKDGVKDDNDVVIVIGAAPAVVGKQTALSHYVDVNNHNIDKVDVPDNNRYVLDEAGSNVGKTYTWYKDTQGNVIGSVLVKDATAYGVITRIWSSINSADGSTKVQANVTYMDGSTATIEVNNVIYYKDAAVGTAIVDAGTQVAGGKATYTDGESDAMKAGTTSAANTVFYVSDSWETNKKADKASGGADILNNHLFRITSAANGYDFAEVAGLAFKSSGSAGTDWNTKNCTAAATTVLSGANFEGLGNSTTTITTGKSVNGTGDTAVKVDSNTLFLVRSVTATGYAFSSVKGFENIGNYVSGEVDHADVDGDHVADYVYITAAAKGEEGWHVFFANAAVTSDDNDNNAQMRYIDYGSYYTVYGYLDGVASSVNISKTQKGAKSTDDNSETDPSKFDGDTIATDFVKAANGNTMWFVYIKNGMVIDVNGAQGQDSTGTSKAVNESTNVTNYATGVALTATDYGMKNGTFQYGNTDESLGKYEKQSIVVVTFTSPTEVKSNVLTIGGKNLNVKDVTPVVGDWNWLPVADQFKKGEATTGVTVIAIYDTATEKATEVYIYAAENGTKYDPGTPAPTASGLTVETAPTGATYINSTGELSFKIKLKDGSGATLSGNETKLEIKGHIEMKRTGGSGGWEQVGKQFTINGTTSKPTTDTDWEAKTSAADAGSLTTSGAIYQVVIDSIIFDGKAVGKCPYNTGIIVKETA